MKVNFSSEHTFVPTWNKNDKLPKEEQITCKLKPLIMGDLLELVDSIQGAQAENKNKKLKKDEVSAAGIRTMVTACGHLLPKYATISNLEQADGPVKIEDLTMYTYYLELAAEILGELAKISMPGEGDEKN